MSGDFVITAGAAGGNFDALNTLVGNPRMFGESSHSKTHIIFGGVRDAAGLRVDMAVQNGITLLLNIKAADGSIVEKLEFHRIAYIIGDPRSADGVLDNMMNSVQAGGTALADFTFQFNGRAGNDIFSGGKLGDTLSGAAGNDLLSGHGGVDTILGGDGDDTLIGGNGADHLTGGAGADMFVFGAASEAQGDRIADFSVADGDKIDLRGFGGQHLIEGPDFGHNAGEVRLTGTSRTVIEGDVDGDGVADFSLILVGATGLDGTSLLFV